MTGKKTIGNGLYPHAETHYSEQKRQNHQLVTPSMQNMVSSDNIMTQKEMMEPLENIANLIHEKDIPGRMAVPKQTKTSRYTKQINSFTNKAHNFNQQPMPDQKYSAYVHSRLGNQSHQASSLLAELPKNKIKSIYDKTPAKMVQASNEYSMSSHLKNNVY